VTSSDAGVVARGTGHPGEKKIYIYIYIYPDFEKSVPVTFSTHNQNEEWQLVPINSTVVAS